MADQATTLAELKALPGADSDFVLSQLEKKATLLEASLALNELLAARLAERKGETSSKPVERPKAEPSVIRMPPTA